MSDYFKSIHINVRESIFSSDTDMSLMEYLELVCDISNEDNQ